MSTDPKTLSKNAAVVLATATAFIWGLSFLSIKTAMTVVPPISLGLIRFIIACLILLALFAFKRRMPRLEMKDLPLMAGTGLLGVTLYFIGENNGVKLLSASEASIIVGTIPVLTMLAERVFTRSRLTTGQYAGAGLSAIGVSLIVVESLRLSPAPLGYLYMTLAALSWVAYAFMTRPLLVKYESLEVTFWQSLFGAVGFVPFALLERVEYPLGAYARAPENASGLALVVGHCHEQVLRGDVRVFELLRVLECVSEHGVEARTHARRALHASAGHLRHRGDRRGHLGLHQRGVGTYLAYDLEGDTLRGIE